MSDLIDHGNYPVIFAHDCRLETVVDGIASLVLVEHRGAEHVIVGRILRPSGNMLAVSKQLASGDPELAVSECRGRA